VFWSEPPAVVVSLFSLIESFRSLFFPLPISFSQFMIYPIPLGTGNQEENSALR
jgi:hypothetical protein